VLQPLEQLLSSSKISLIGVYSYTHFIIDVIATGNAIENDDVTDETRNRFATDGQTKPSDISLVLKRDSWVFFCFVILCTSFILLLRYG